MDRRSFFKGLIGTIAAASIPLPPIIEAASVAKAPVYIDSMMEWLSRQIQLDIDWNMMKLIEQQNGKYGKDNPFSGPPPTLEELGYVLGSPPQEPSNAVILTAREVISNINVPYQTT